MNNTFLIIVHFGPVRLTVDCLKSIYQNHDAPLTILVNNSLDNSLPGIIKEFKNVLLLTPKTNLGFAGANNLALKKAIAGGAQNVILLNNDTIIPAGFVAKITDFAVSHPSVGIISPKIYFAKGFEYHKKDYKKKDLGRVFWYAGGEIDWNNVYAKHRGVDQVDHGQFDTCLDTDFATGCAMLIKRQVIAKAGLINEKYFLYYEDVDYSLTVKQNGFKVVYFPGAFIWHKNAGSSQGPGSVLHQYYQTRNRLYFGFKFAPLRAKLALLRESFKHLAKGGVVRSAVTDFYFNKMGKARL